MRHVVLLVAMALAPSTAAAQSWHVLYAPLRADGADVGELFGARVRPRGWDGERVARVAYASEGVTLEARVRLTDARTYVAVGVGASAEVRTDTAFRVELRPLSWAPLLGRAPGGVRVALPPGMPAASGVLGAASQVPAGAHAPSAAFAHAGVPASFTPACGALVLYAAPDLAAPAWRLDGARAALALGVERGVFTRARVFVDGFVVHGWLAGAPPDCAGVPPEAPMTMGCGDGYGRGLAVTLPAGTALYATRDARRPFARLARDAVGLEPLEHAAAIACAEGRCRRAQPEPRGVARWIVPGRDRAAGWVLHAWVRTPAERLAPATSGGGFGGCWTHPDDWPRP
ncbi:MAG: hypothetical protein KF729_24305 [Sandaracinaceae bacterium]|nr:hypothetical protein [Sandaracinaceae bacterium]